jgi:hypothetical protein
MDIAMNTIIKYNYEKNYAKHFQYKKKIFHEIDDGLVRVMQN